jgi:hypothetical protein
MMVQTYFLQPAAALSALVIWTGCSHDLPPPAIESPMSATRASDDFREWVRRHQVDPEKTLAGLHAELDRMTSVGRKDFDRQSQSRVGYLDIRAELKSLMASHGPDATIRDVTGDKPGGR